MVLCRRGWIYNRFSVLPFLLKLNKKLMFLSERRSRRSSRGGKCIEKKKIFSFLFFFVVCFLLLCIYTGSPSLQGCIQRCRYTLSRYEKKIYNDSLFSKSITSAAEKMGWNFLIELKHNFTFKKTPFRVKTFKFSLKLLKQIYISTYNIRKMRWFPPSSKVIVGLEILSSIPS